MHYESDEVQTGERSKEHDDEKNKQMRKTC